MSAGEEEDELKTTLTVKVVQVDLYKGIETLTTGQNLELRRDYVNVHDSNAIEVRHIGRGVKIGMISRAWARKLAAVVDATGVTVHARFNGLLPKARVGLASIDMQVTIEFPDVATARSVGAGLSESAGNTGAPHGAATAVATEKDAAPETSASPLPEDPAITASLRESPIDCLLPAQDATLKDFTDYPRFVTPLKTSLLPFQRQGLAWMIRMEHPTLPESPDARPVQLWGFRRDSEGVPFYVNVASHTGVRAPPVLKRGGILADEMGLGKTLQTIALLATDDTGQGVLPTPEWSVDDRYDDMSLVVCPLSVVSNWTAQLRAHLKPGTLSHVVYHGERRHELTKRDLRRFDIVIVTYQTVVQEYARLQGGDSDSERPQKRARSAKPLLFAIKWRRLVLDEGHIIRNAASKTFAACAALRAERRWILTGTPIINSARDLGAMLSFLRMCKPLDDKKEWVRCVERVRKGWRGARACDSDRGADANGGGNLLRANGHNGGTLSGESGYELVRKNNSIEPNTHTPHANSGHDIISAITGSKNTPDAETDSTKSVEKGTAGTLTATSGLPDRAIDPPKQPSPNESAQDPEKELIRSVIHSTTLRRTKNMRDANGHALVQLPPIAHYVHRVDLEPATRELYDQISDMLRAMVANPAAGTDTATYTQLLVLVLRLRQVACDPTLCPAEALATLEASALAAGETSLTGQTLCGVCVDLPIDSRVSSCGHLFCFTCIVEAIDARGECPTCACPLTRRSLAEENEGVIFSDDVEWSTPGRTGRNSPGVLGSPKVQGSHSPSPFAGGASGETGAKPAAGPARPPPPKTQALIDLLKKASAGEKSLVFSQWTTHLDRIQDALQAEEIATCRLDGSMSQSQREQVMEHFTTSPTVNVMLLSLKAGALGLNLTCASQVFLMDPWWQSAIEQQAIDRVYRIGQTKPVKVYQIVARDTVEDKVLAIQKRKQELIKHAFDHKSASNNMQAKLSDVVELLS